MANDFPAYTKAQLAAFGRAIVQGSGLALGTESGSDVGVTLDSAAALLMGSQVAAKYAYDQLLPGTSAAQTLSDELDRLGIDYSKEPTKARGRMIVSGATPLAAGTRVQIPATSMPDGVAREYVTITGFEPRATVDADETASVTVGLGATRSRARLRSAANSALVKVGDVLFTGSVVDTSTAVAIVTAAYPDLSFELWPPLPTGLADGATLTVYGHVGVVEIEAPDAGVIGNSPPSTYYFDEDLAHGFIVLGMSGGTEGQERQPADIARVAAWVQDHRAWPPGGGNVQHWREIAMKCPTVMLDDAIVYRGVRGPTSVDIVAIGMPYRVPAPGYDDARTDFMPGAANGRVLHPAAIAELQAWCNANAAYHDDVRVLPVSHVFHGQGAFSSGDRSHYANRGVIDLRITPAYGYGNDCGTDWQSIGHDADTDTARLYVTGTMPAFQPGHRVWFRLGAKGGDQQLACTVVARINAVSRNRDYVTVPDFGKFGRIIDPSRWASALEVIDWGSAGPLTQPVLDAVYDYYGALGPGSFVTPDYGAGYQRARGHANVRSFSSVRVDRWPFEGYRWPSGVRTNMLLAKVRAIPGVISAAMAGSAMAPVAIDYDPAPLKTAALGSVRVRTL